MPFVPGDLFDRPDLSASIALARRPILLYGTGDGADKTLAWLAGFGVSPAGVFVSPEHARGQSFRGYPVFTPDEALKLWKDPLVLLCFASRDPAVIGTLAALARRCDLYVPDFPVAGGALFDASFARLHREECDAAYALFSDDRSREVYSSLLSYKLSGDLGTLLGSCDAGYDPFALLPIGRFARALDGGAYDGDTVRDPQGTTYDPADIMALIDRASILLDGQKMTFDPTADFVPDDYESLKASNKNLRSDNARMAREYNDRCKELFELKDRLRAVEEDSTRASIEKELERDCILFCARCDDFIKKVGGYAYLSDKLNSLPDKERRSYIKCVQMINAWAENIIQNSNAE